MQSVAVEPVPVARAAPLLRPLLAVPLVEAPPVPTTSPRAAVSLCNRVVVSDEFIETIAAPPVRVHIGYIAAPR